MKTMYKYVSILLCLLMLFSLTVINSTAEEMDTPFGNITTDKITIRFASSNSGQEGEKKVQEALNAFVAEHPNVEIVLETAETTNYASKISMDVATGNTPDVFSYWRPEATYGVDKFYEAGALADLSEILETPRFKDYFSDFAVATGTFNGTFIALPENYAFICMLANTEIFEKCGLKLPETWDDWLNSVKVLKENGYIPFCVSTKAVASGWERLMGYTLDRYCTTEADWNDPNRAYKNNSVLEMFAGNLPFNTPEAITAFTRLHELVSGNCAEDAMTMDDTQVCEKYFNTGRAGIYVNGSYGVPTISEEIIGKCKALSWPAMPGAAYNEPIVDKDVVNLYYASAQAWADPVKKPIIYKIFEMLYSDAVIDASVYGGGKVYPINGFELDASRLSEPLVEAYTIATQNNMVKWCMGRAQPEPKEIYYPYYTDFWAGNMTGEEFALKLHEIFYKGD